MGDYKTQQENFWAGEFGNEYIERNQSDEYLASNLNFFTNALQKADKLNTVIEFGANVGMNLKAIKLLFPHIDLNAIEINTKAVEMLSMLVDKKNIYTGSILEYPVPKQFDLVLIKGVLIHINPNELPGVYEKLYHASNKYILVAEYYNPSPVTITYRGHQDRLFKRDFAGELLDCYPDLKLIDYGFAYRRDVKFPQDDITWFLVEKC
ncbi:MAG: pseudaminic acid biosynthesis-associated methylase [Sphingobacteriales bacterium 39-19]|nr:hypothetical protein [Sphingobacteriales bacterium]OJW08936.1 MAG: pseudaminic acid biosynthesis-associated methylase [Sphingobacteriales bacterium 39-19]